MPPSLLFLSTTETAGEGEWTLTGLSAPCFVLVKVISPGVYRETYLIKSTSIAKFKNDSQDMSYEAPNSLAPKAFLISKGLTPADYKMAVVTSQGKSIAGMPDPQAGSNTRFEVRNNGATVVGQLFRSDNAGSWQDTWSLTTNFVWGNATTDVRAKAAPGLPDNPAVWAAQAKILAAGGEYIQYSYSFGPVI
ncbi:MAG: hypothetical protein ACI9VR_002753 [Cognaticolwellia sp.]